MAGGFPLIVEMILSGFLFWFIMVLVLVMGALGYLMENDDYDSDVDLQARALLNDLIIWDFIDQDPSRPRRG
jgi:hypothetical protein